MATNSVLALDVGKARIGVAYAGDGLNIPRRVTTLEVSHDIWDNLHQLIDEYHPHMLIIGMPRSLDGQETEQSRYVLQFANECRQRFDIPVHFQDEALTSVRAKEILSMQKGPTDKKEIDAVAASLILSDYLEEHKQ